MPANSPAKARAYRLPLQAYASDGLARVRNWLTAICLLAILGWLFSGRADREARYSPGSVSAVHQHLGCESCHSGDAPIRPNTFLAWLNIGAVERNKLWHAKTDMLCQSCHPVSSGSLARLSNDGVNSAIAQVIPIAPHTLHQKVEMVGTCASCHLEHRGQDHLPSRVDDTACTDCHTRIEEFRTADHQNIAVGVGSFETSHPEFGSLRSDPGRLKFNHELHMSPGVLRAGDRASMSKSLDDYPNHNGSLDGFVDAAGRIELDCQFCHQPLADSATALENVSAMDLSTAAGTFMSMPNYEQHCRVCHSIDLVPNQTFTERGAAAFASKFDVPELRIEHGAGPKRTSDALKIYFALQFVAPKEIRAEFESQGLNMPLQLPTDLWNFDDPPPELKQILDQELATATAVVRKSCLHCHFASAADMGTGVPHIELIEPGRGVFERTWLMRGKFDHAAHRDVQCTQCHELNAGKGELPAAKVDLSADRPMISGLESCRVCHTSQPVAAPARPGPVTCVSCHTYHGGGNR
jgi:hypothetical protein